MIDYVGRSRSPLDDMQQWGEYFGQVDARRQSRWQQNEARRRYDEENRYNRAGAISDSGFMAGNAGLFDDASSPLGGLRPQGVPVAASAAPVPAASTGVQGVAPAGGAPASAPPAGIATLDPSAALASGTTLEPNTYPTRNGSQQTAYQTYALNVRGIRDGRHGPEPLRRALGTMVRTGVITQTEANNEYGRVLHAVGQSTRRAHSNATIERHEDTSSAPAVDPAADLATGAVSAGLAGPEDTGISDEAQGQVAGDISRSLRPTREMILLRTAIQDNIRRAELAAQHGQRDVAQQAFAMALQGQAAYIQNERMLLYRAANEGSDDAMASLLEEFYGYPANTIQVQPTNTRRTQFNLQVRNDADELVTGWDGPRSRAEIMSGLLNLVDAEGAAARTEANLELQRAYIQAGATLEVANITQRTAFMRMITDAQIAQMNNQAAAQLQQGEGSLELDRENGIAYFHYTTTDAEGNPVREVEVIRMQAQPIVNAGNRPGTIDVPVSTRVQRQTGVQGVGAN